MTKRPGIADAIEYPKTPNQDSWGVAPCSVVPYTTHAPIPDAKNDMAIPKVPVELRADLELNLLKTKRRNKQFRRMKYTQYRQNNTKI